VQADRKHRVLAGLSMGGRPVAQLRSDAPRHVRLGRRVLASPNTKPGKELIPDPAAAKEQLKLLWLSCGNKDGLIRIAQGTHGYPQENNLPHVWHVDGHAHDGPEWKASLFLFSQRIFR